MFSSNWTVCLSTLCLILLIQSVASTSVPQPESIKLNFTRRLQDSNSFTRSLRGNIYGDRTTTSPFSQHKDFIIRQFDAAEYKPRMEVVAVGLNYDNETATLRVSVFVGIPTINRTQHSEISEASALMENFTNYEIYLTALSDDNLSEPPSSCLSDPFLQHSRREVFVGCPLSNGRNTSMSDFPTTPGTANHVSPSWETSCVDVNSNNFTVVFRHVYSAYYCLLIQPQAGIHTRRTFTRMVHYQTNKTPVDITKWQTTIDLQQMPSRQCISAAFTLPDSSYQIISRQLRVDLMQVSGEMCNDPNQIKLIWSEIIAMEPGKQAADVEFFGKPPGLYCVVVVPLDERCDGNNFWKSKGGSCARHSAKAVQLQAPSLNREKNGSNKQAMVLRTVAMDAWATFIIVCATACGLVLASLLGVVVMYRRRQKKQLQRRQNQLLLEWGPAARVSQTESVVADVIDAKHLPSSMEKDHALVVSDPVLKVKKTPLLTSVPISVLLLYRRDDLQIAQRAADLRNRLQSECGDQLKVYDYGDESQWEEIALEGLDWLPNRICRNSMTNDFVKRVIVIHSPLQPICQITKNEQEQDEENDEDKENTSPLLINEMCDSVESVQKILKLRPRESLSNNADQPLSIDQEFFYGMQLLLGCMRESGDDCTNAGYQRSLYSRVFNVRYTDILDSAETDNENRVLVYPNLQVAPFTCYLLPGHFNQLLQHITAPI